MTMWGSVERDMVDDLSLGRGFGKMTPAAIHALSSGLTCKEMPSVDVMVPVISRCGCFQACEITSVWLSTCGLCSAYLMCQNH